MLTPKQTRIFGAFLMRPYREMTYGEIKGYVGEKSNSVVQRAISRFLAEGLVRKRKVGNIILYRTNLGNASVLAYFGILVGEMLPTVARKCLKRVIEEIADISFVSMVVFGSYAEGNQKGDSDLDVALFVNSGKEKKNCKAAMNSAELKCIIRLDAHVFTRDEMLKMLKDRRGNVGKEIARRHLAIHNPAIFYSILDEGIRNGFRFVPCSEGRK